jgi:hypothetical protein
LEIGCAVKVIPHDAITGLIQEMGFLKILLKRVIDCAQDYKWAGGVQTIMNKMMSRICGHCMLLIFKKGKRDDHKSNIWKKQKP